MAIGAYDGSKRNEVPFEQAQLFSDQTQQHHVCSLTLAML
jgi:hypothetical protein